MPALFALVNSLTPADVGSRVVVRRALPEGGQGDVLGQLVSWSGQVLVVRTRRGHLVAIAESAVLAGKRVPPPPARPTRGPGPGGVDELVDVAARGWPGVEEEWLGRWWLRAAGGFTGRANCVVPLGHPGRPLDEALTAVRQWYAERGLPALASVPVGSELDRELGARGWVPARPGEVVLVQTAPVQAALDVLDVWEASAAARTPAADVAVAMGPLPPEDWLATYRGAAHRPEARQVLASPPGAVTFASIEAGGTAACGRAVVLAGWVGLAAVEVRPEHRRRGLARALMAALLRHGRERGAPSAYLQVDSANAAALALYRQLGFRPRYRYHYLAPGPGA